ncbi:hypothetical protein SAMN02745163_01957 [Clostridium cavendishii DSM 21758]|uniref:Uncharacterized protein n=1 Tax=Clostridium cavendishii DSM 21758 TaxID=1121302 RepID=A0A1M6J9M4_9CLOT|nr:HNH endonuclease [Clostridium cavendishii]SHJ43351.1 hypothetical protein SAMN02745163_01957 [Clostridium cavendishii DSM 21758]
MAVGGIDGYSNGESGYDLAKTLLKSGVMFCGMNYFMSDIKPLRNPLKSVFSKESSEAFGTLEGKMSRSMLEIPEGGVAGDNRGNFLKGGSNTRSSGQYHTFHEFNLDSDFLYASDAVQFRQANKSLIDRLNSDAKFRKDMFKRNPELKTWLDSKPNLSNSPTGFTWHHAEDSGEVEI